MTRVNVRVKARNAHHAYSGRPAAHGSSFKRRARHSDRIFPNHQARCALLIPLRFEFAKEFRPRGRTRRGSPFRPDGADSVSAVRRPPHFRRGGVTPNRGNNVTSSRRSEPAGRVDHRAPARARLKRRARIAVPGLPPRLRTRKNIVAGSNCLGRNTVTVICMYRLVIARKAGRPERLSARTAQFFGSDFARRTCCKPSRLVLVASPPSSPRHSSG